MAYSWDVRSVVNGYLEKVAAELANLSRDEKESIIENVEAHVYEELKKNFGDAATAADAEAVISRMAPPKSYAEAGGAASEASAAPPGKKLCLYPIVGLLIAPIGLYMLVVCFSNFVTARRIAAQGGIMGAWWLNWPGMLVVALIPVATTVLGVIGIKKIRESGGQLTGMVWAVLAAVFFPACIVLGGILCAS